MWRGKRSAVSQGVSSHGIGVDDVDDAEEQENELECESYSSQVGRESVVGWNVHGCGIGDDDDGDDEDELVCESSWCGGEEGVGSVITVLEMMMGMVRMMIMRWRVSHRDAAR